MTSPRFDNADLYLMAIAAPFCTPQQTHSSKAIPTESSATIQKTKTAIVDNAEFIARMSAPAIQFQRATLLSESRRRTGTFCLTFQFDAADDDESVSFVLVFHCTRTGQINLIQPGQCSGRQIDLFHNSAQEIADMQRAVLDTVQVDPLLAVDPFYQQFLDDGDVEQFTREFVNASIEQ